MQIFDLATAAGGAPLRLGSVSDEVDVYLAASPLRYAIIDPKRALPAVYIALWRDTPDEVVVGATSRLAGRMSNTSWRLRGTPDAVLAIAARRGGPFVDRDALALERIAAHAIGRRMTVDSGLELPFGAPRGLERYTQLQVVWGGVVQILGVVAPPLACAWTGAPGVLPHGSAPAPGAAVLELAAGRIVAQVYERDGGWAVRAGSLLRRIPTRSAASSAFVCREELLFAGALEPYGLHALRLTRDVRRRSLSGCGHLIVTQRGVYGWQRIDDVGATA